MAIPIRVIIIILAVLATTVDYITRNNLNLAIVSMVSDETNSTSEFQYDVCPLPGKAFVNESTLDSSTKVSSMSAPRYDWSPKTQGIILGAFFYAYVAMQIPSGRLAELFGGKWIMAVGVLGSGLLNLLTPAIASSVVLLTMSRIALGFIQGGIFPAGYGLLYKWFPQKERSLAFGLLDMGSSLGSITATLLTGYLSEHGFAGGWPSAFYVAGIIACGAFLFFAPLVTSTPEENRFISKSELAYINQGREPSGKTKPLKVPWLEILTSKRVIAYIVAKFCIGWTFITLQMKLPAFMNDILHISPTENGLLNAMLYVATCTTLSTCGLASEFVIRKGWLSRTNTRKAFVAIAYIGTSCCVLMVPMVGCSAKAVTGFLVLSQLFQGMASGGDLPMPGEMTTNFPATVYSIMNMVVMTAGFMVPYVAGVILESGKDIIFCWNAVFILSGCISIFGAIVFILFAEAEIQPWDKPMEGDSSQMTHYRESISSHSKSFSAIHGMSFTEEM